MAQNKTMAKRKSRRVWGWLLAVALVLPLAAFAMTSEDKEFKAAFDELTDKQYHQAELDFTAFLNSYSNSVHGAEAVLCKAQAQLWQSNNSAAISTLQEHLSHAGDLAPDYIFYIARATSASTNAALRDIARNRNIGAFLEDLAKARPPETRGVA